MKFRTFATILVGTALAGAGSFAVMNIAVNPGSATAMQEAQMVDVIVVRSEIAFGQAIEPAMLMTKSWPKDALVPGLYTSMDPFLAGEPRRALGRMFPGEPLMVAKLSTPGELVTIVQKLTPGHRAMAISVNASTAVGGFVAPGDRVDIMMTYTADGELRAGTVLQNVRVVGIDQTSESQQGSPQVARTITVEVLPDDGQKLALAQKAGQLSLSLRERDAPEHEPLEQVQLGDLFDTRQPEPVVEVVATEEPAPAPVPVRSSVIVRRGLATEQVFLK
ncbi:pilus assembly protein CpaB [Jannaschia faecimaris]|uniref:Pilus assembly protein CpaB n=2 Tax=Jannaschia faecimaris TaxID=1244108 RepID=A0A1H3TM30_9RHOB|nr:pilus assembly protein CpaB [Jannaschia faecimaris]